jgi:hypothetical protein
MFQSSIEFFEVRQREQLRFLKPWQVRSRREQGSLFVQMAASREKKQRDINMLKGMLSNDDTLLVAGFRFQGLSVRNFIESPTTRTTRRITNSLPPGIPGLRTYRMA